MDNWGGSGIEKVVFDFILQNIPEGSTVIELGAGHVSTREFAKHYKTYSVEDNPIYIGHYKVNYIHAPIIDGWYDVEILKKKLPPKDEQKMIFIDGNMRTSIISHLYLFNPEAMYIIHDTYRDELVRLAQKLGVILKREPVFNTNGDYWATI